MKCSTNSWLTILLLFANPGFAHENFHTEILLDTTRTIVGEPIQYPQQSPAKLTSAVITIPAGTSTGWHQHTVPLVGYLLSGTLEMEYANGQRQTLKPGQAIAEAMHIAHIGANPGLDSVKIFVVFMGAANTSLSQTSAPPPMPTQPLSNSEPTLVDLADYDKRLKFDIRYAGHHNFTGKPLYPAARALLQKTAADALVRAHTRLQSAGYGLLVFDAYRPWRISRKVWDQHPQHRAFLADPLKGSRHNRGCAVDLTLFDLATGKEVMMPSSYDEFTERAHPDYSGGEETARKARDRLRAAMESEGFRVYENEWWHFDYQGWEQYPLLDIPLQ